MRLLILLLTELPELQVEQQAEMPLVPIGWMT